MGGRCGTLTAGRNIDSKGSWCQFVFPWEGDLAYYWCRFFFGEKKTDIAPRSSGEEDSGSLKPFRWNPAGNQSRPVEPDQQPEASLAWRVGDHPCEA